MSLQFHQTSERQNHCINAIDDLSSNNYSSFNGFRQKYSIVNNSMFIWFHSSISCICILYDLVCSTPFFDQWLNVNNRNLLQTLVLQQLNYLLVLAPFEPAQQSKKRKGKVKNKNKKMKQREKHHMKNKENTHVQLAYSVMQSML